LISQGRWWFSQRGLTKDGALSSTAEIFFHDLTEDINLSGLLGLLASSVEVRELLAKRAGKSKKEKRARANQTDELEKALVEKAKEVGLQENDLFSPIVSTGPARRANMLLWSHLLRYDNMPAEMLEGEFTLWRQAVSLKRIDLADSILSRTSTNPACHPHPHP
jgi:translocation protein SEC63